MPKAILSVHDKTGLVEFARGLSALGWTLLASGGTARLLRENQVAVHRSGRIHRLAGNPGRAGENAAPGHPRRAAGAPHPGGPGRAAAAGLGLHRPGGGQPVSLRADHRQTRCHPGEAIENIDIGGVTLIRAAAKNHERVTLLCDPADYAACWQSCKTARSARRRAAPGGERLSATAHYDAAISLPGCATGRIPIR